MAEHFILETIPTGKQRIYTIGFVLKAITFTHIQGDILSGYQQLGVVWSRGNYDRGRVAGYHVLREANSWSWIWRRYSDMIIFCYFVVNFFSGLMSTWSAMTSWLATYLWHHFVGTSFASPEDTLRRLSSCREPIMWWDFGQLYGLWVILVGLGMAQLWKAW